MTSVSIRVTRINYIYVVKRFFFFKDLATTEIYTLSLHDALPISGDESKDRHELYGTSHELLMSSSWDRSEEHTSELQSPYDLVCRLLLEKKKETKEMEINEKG